ncbi:hypothetical protein IMCC20628_00944 [Hoeflea sp. IMCC20628]|nr:hypothetical protein IMCC20628_00944 [Hoeflea sp. IMCC20628]
MARLIENFRFDDIRLADRLEAESKELRSRLRYESDKERRYIQDEIDEIESILCQMCC